MVFETLSCKVSVLQTASASNSFLLGVVSTMATGWAVGGFGAAMLIENVVRAFVDLTSLAASAMFLLVEFFSWFFILSN